MDTTEDRDPRPHETPAAPSPGGAPGGPPASGDPAARLPMVGTAPPAPPADASGPAGPAGETPAPDAAAAAPAAPPGPPSPEAELLMGQVIETLRTVYDPEIPVNIYELGMIYNVAIEGPGTVNVRMTLTSPSCPVAGSLPGDVQLKVQNIPGVATARVDLVWDPPWNPSMMTDAAKLELGML